jgi:hypothetical protein
VNKIVLSEQSFYSYLVTFGIACFGFGGYLMLWRQGDHYPILLWSGLIGGVSSVYGFLSSHETYTNEEMESITVKSKHKEAIESFSKDLDSLDRS